MSESSEFNNADYYLTFDAIVLKDYERASKFFITHCGSSLAAKEYLVNVINSVDGKPSVSVSNTNDISATAGIKRPISTIVLESDNQDGGNHNKLQQSSYVGQTIPKLFSGANAHTTLSQSTGNDIISDLYVNDDIDHTNFTLVTLCPNEIKLCAHMIGKQGSNITEIKSKTGIKTQLESNCTFTERNVLYIGALKGTLLAMQLMLQKVEERSDLPPNYLTTTIKLIVPNELVAKVIGKQGITIKKVQAASGARTQAQTEEEMYQSGHYYGRTIAITGTLRQRLHATYLIVRQLAADKDLPAAWKGSTPQLGSASSYHSLVQHIQMQGQLQQQAQHHHQLQPPVAYPPQQQVMSMTPNTGVGMMSRLPAYSVSATGQRQQLSAYSVSATGQPQQLSAYSVSATGQPQQLSAYPVTATGQSQQQRQAAMYDPLYDSFRR